MGAANIKMNIFQSRIIWCGILVISPGFISRLKQEVSWRTVWHCHDFAGSLAFSFCFVCLSFVVALLFYFVVVVFFLREAAQNRFAAASKNFKKYLEWNTSKRKNRPRSCFTASAESILCSRICIAWVSPETKGRVAQEGNNSLHYSERGDVSYPHVRPGEWFNLFPAAFSWSPLLESDTHFIGEFTAMVVPHMHNGLEQWYCRTWMQLRCYTRCQWLSAWWSVRVPGRASRAFSLLLI